MIERAHVIGAGRAGSAIAARLRERGLELSADNPELVLLCVPDRAIAEVAAATSQGPWVAHVSGATPLAALDPHVRRFSVHPLQTFTRARGAEQLDGAFAAVSAETDEAREVALWLARTLGLEPFTLADSKRVAYHAGAAIASSYLVTLRRAAGSLLEAAGAPPEALDPLMRRTIENDFELTGPIARGDWATVDAHVAAIRAERAGARGDVRDHGGDDEGASVRTLRTIDEARQELQAFRSGRIGLVPTMGALHAGHRALIDAARAECDTVVVSLFVNPAQFDEAADLASYPRDEERDAALAADAGADILFAPEPAEIYPAGFQTWVDVEQLSRGLEGAYRPGHFRGVATVCLKLFNIVRPQFAYFGQKDAQQIAVVRRMVRDLEPRLDGEVDPDRARSDGLAISSRNVLLSGAERARRAGSSPRARDARPRRRPRRTRRARRGLRRGRRLRPPVLAAAVRVGSTRLIDNVILNEEER